MKEDGIIEGSEDSVLNRKKISKICLIIKDGIDNQLIHIKSVECADMTAPEIEEAARKERQRIDVPVYTFIIVLMAFCLSAGILQVLGTMPFNDSFFSLFTILVIIAITIASWWQGCELKRILEKCGTFEIEGFSTCDKARYRKFLKTLKAGITAFLVLYVIAISTILSDSFPIESSLNSFIVDILLCCLPELIAIAVFKFVLALKFPCDSNVLDLINT